MADGRLRSFVAVPIADGLRRAIAARADRLRVRPGGDRVRWVRSENLHVTLRFLGDIDAGQVPRVLGCLCERIAQQPAFELAFAGAELFPTPRRPRVVALMLAPAEPLAQLARAVEASVVAAGLPPETRPFRAHLTLGRVRERRCALDVTASDTALSDPLPVTEAVLFRSELRSSGAIHTPLGRAALGPPSSEF